MNKKEKANLTALQDVCEIAVCHVGQANYSERQRLAEWNIRKAFEDFEDGKKPQWIESDESDDDDN